MTSAMASITQLRVMPSGGQAAAMAISKAMQMIPKMFGVVPPKNSIFKTDTKASGMDASAANTRPKMVWPMLFVRPSRILDLLLTSGSSRISTARWRIGFSSFGTTPAGPSEHAVGVPAGCGGRVRHWRLAAGVRADIERRKRVDARARRPVRQAVIWHEVSPL